MGIFPAQPLPREGGTTGAAPLNRSGSPFDAFNKHRQPPGPATPPAPPVDPFAEEEPITLSPAEIAQSPARATYNGWVSEVNNKIGHHPTIHSIFDPQFPSETGGGH